MKNLKIVCVLISLFCLSALQAQETLSQAAIQLTQQDVTYDPSYFSIDYPNGDVPADKGVCTDVVIRAYRILDVDLQQLVHEDMKANFHKYPQNWGLNNTDSNIDHRRVPNLMTFFSRFGTIKTNTKEPEKFIPGDIVAWNLGRGLTHIGVVINKKSIDKKRNLVVHNIGGGQVIEDVLFNWKIIGHYSFKKIEL
ncbi:DUF1287 domain-containing protein [uncultured Marixanthomonas sp.]|uniref:DUF1287 domain-containing protein n=1 Tax=uncultured Marixanthomonas sp. TaxID=757245 RepID=UPI0030D83E1B|tara:strand:+ start:54640 stop:55224 length:585 start_codon:yes stop_codon:yes gene_type:complete